MKQRKKIIVLLVLVAVGSTIWYYNTRPPATTATVGAWSMSFPPLAVDNPQLHWWKAEAARKTDYGRSRRNIFSAVAPPSETQQKAIQKAQQAPPPVVPPVQTPAPLPVKFFGYATLAANGPRRAFLTDGENVLIVSEGETLLGRFRILRIGNNSLEYEEIASGLRGTATLEEQGPQA